MGIVRRPRSGRFTRAVRRGCAVMALVAGAAVPQPTLASELRLVDDPDSDDTYLEYVAADGEVNQVSVHGVSQGRGWLQDGFGDVTIVPEPPCTIGQPGGPPEPRFGSCPADTLAWFEADLGDGADAAYGSASIYSIPLVYSGGDGPDTLYGHYGPDTLYGDDGVDQLSGSLGDDWLDGGAGSDTLAGGDGVDVAAYDERTEAVAVRLDGISNDGATGEGDSIGADVEAVVGGSAGDALTGDEQDNGLFGGPGADTLDGRAGEDFLSAGEDNDTVQARDGAIDDIDCGPGVDTATVDQSDITTACETVLLPAPPVVVPPSSQPEAAADVTGPQLTVRGRTAVRLRVAIRQGLRVRVRCSESCGIVIQLRLGARAAKRLGLGTGRKPVIVGRASAFLQAAGGSSVVTELRRRVKRALFKATTVRLDVVVTASDMAGNATSSARRVTLKR